MSGQTLNRVGADFSADPIAAIARAERAGRADPVTQPQIVDGGPDLVEPSRQLAPQGLSGAVDRALGSVHLPTLLELANALEDLSAHVESLADIDPALSEVAGMVLQDEQRKVMRYLDLRDS
jgi:hypothetical protein